MQEELSISDISAADLASCVTSTGQGVGEGVPLRKGAEESLGAIHSTKISGNFGLKILNGSVRSNRKSF